MKIKYIPYLKTVLFPLIFLTFPFALTEQFIFEAASKLEDKITYGIVGIILGLVETFLVLILLGYGIKKVQGERVQVGSHYRKHLRDLIIECFRALGRIAVGLLLIVPGIKRTVEYYLVPYIVQFDQNYLDGKIDVLEECERLLKGHFLKFSTLLCLTQIVTFVLQIASVNFNLFTSPLAWILFYMIEICVQVAVFLMFYNYYIKLKNEFKPEGNL